MIDPLAILIIVISVAFLILLWVVVGVRHLGHLQKVVFGQWEEVDIAVRKRQDLLPNLIETVRAYSDQHEDLLETLIADRYKAAHEKKLDASRVEAEIDLSEEVNKVIDLRKEVEGLGKDTNFLEIKKDIEDSEINIEMQTKKYNQMVREYNRSRKSFLMVPLSAVFRFKVMNIFEVES